MASLRQLVESRRDEIAAVVRRHFLVQFDPGSSLFDLMDLEAELTTLLGVNVHVVSAGGLRDRDHIREEAVSLL